MKCSECGRNIPYGASCPCRGEDSGKRRQAKSYADDANSRLPPDTCSYTYGTMSCPLYPTIQLGGKWMCSTHSALDRKNDHSKAVSFLRDVLAQPNAIKTTIAKKHWSDEMVDNWANGIKPEGWEDKIYPKYCKESPKIPRNLLEGLKSHQNKPQIQKETDEIDEILGW